MDLILTGDHATRRPACCSRHNVLDPTAYYYFRVLLNWRRQMAVGIGPNGQVTSYWDKLANDRGRTKGPIHLVYNVLKACRIQPSSPVSWKFPNGLEMDIVTYPDFSSAVRECVVSAIWAELAAHRQGYADMSNGLDYNGTLSWPNRIKMLHKKDVCLQFCKMAFGHRPEHPE